MPTFAPLFSHFRHRKTKMNMGSRQEKSESPIPSIRSPASVSQGKGTKEVQLEKSAVIVSNTETPTRTPSFAPAEKSLPSTVTDMSAQLDPGYVDRRIPSTKEAETVESGVETTSPSLPVSAGQFHPYDMGHQAEVSDTIPDKETTDVAQLWQKALDQWQLQTAEFKNKLAKEDVERLEKVKTADDIVTYIAATTNKFIYWRHPRTKLDDFRSVVSNNLGYIQALGQVVADAASASFPPTASIYKAVTIMIACANSVSADYDLMADFFNEVGMFLGCVNILEGSISEKKIVNGPLGKILVEIFVTVLTLCGMSTHYMARGRALHALRNFFKGEDGPLKAAYANIKRKAAEENVYVTHESFVGIQAVKGWRMDERMDRNDAKQDDIMQVMVTSFGSIDSKVDKLIEAEQGRKRAEDKRKEADELTKLKQKFEKDEITTARVGKYSDVQRNRLKGTGTWLLCEEAFKAWREQAFQVLWILGEAGTGKSHLSGLIVETLLKDVTQTSGTSIGYFFFSKATLSVRKALCSVVSQIAQTDRAFCAKATREIGTKSPDELRIEELWSRFFIPNYQKGSAAQLYIVLDGIDEADPLEADQLLQLLGSKEIEMLQVQVLLVGRAKLGPDIEKHFRIRHEIIKITSEKNYSDVKRLIEGKIAERPRLRSLPAEQQDEIIKIMLDKAQGMMLYVDLKINDLERITQPRSILSTARNLPQGLEKLYEKDLTDIEHSAEEQDLPYLNILLRWVTFATRPLTIQELNCIIKAVYKLKDDFDITSEINLRSGSLFTLVRFGREVVAKDQDDKPLEPVMMDDLFSAHDGGPGAEADATKTQSETKEQENEINEQNDEGTTVKLRHASLGDYLRSAGIKHTHMTARLSDGEFELASLSMQIMCDPNKDLSDIWQYATESWLEHLAKVDHSSASREQVFQIALRIAQVLTSPDSAKRMISYYDMDSIDWRDTASATGGQYRDVVLKWLDKAHGLGLTTGKDSGLPKSIGPTELGLRNSTTDAVANRTDIAEIPNLPRGSSPVEATHTGALMLESAPGPSAEGTHALDRVLTAQLQTMMTRCVATAVEQVLKRLKIADTGESILDELRYSEPGNDVGLPLIATNDQAGAQVDHNDISVDAALSCIDIGGLPADDRHKELTNWIDEVVENPSRILVCLTQQILSAGYQGIDIVDMPFFLAWQCFRSTDRIVPFNLPASIIKDTRRNSHLQQKMQCLVEAFPELETDSKAHIISFEAHLHIGNFLLDFGAEEASLSEFNKCLSLAKTNLERCKVLKQIADVYTLQKRYEEGCKLLESIFEFDLGTDEDALNLIKEIHATLGGIYKDKGEHARALEAYEAACTNEVGQGNPEEADPSFTGILKCLHNLHRHEDILEKITRWDDSTRDRWLLEGPLWFQTIFHTAIKTLERSQFVDNWYIGAIKRFRFAESTYFNWLTLANAYWHFLDQPAKALEMYKRVFRAVAKKLRSDSEPQFLYKWREARSNFAELLYETALDAKPCDHDHIFQYLLAITVDFTMKAAEANDYWSQADDRAQNLLCARIYKLLRKTTEARKILDREFRLCIDLLEDDVGFNDIHAFRGLTQLLAVAGCKEEARLAYSLSFSNVNPQNAAQQEKETEKDSDEEEESKALGDENLDSESLCCDGCYKLFRNFAEPAYTCLVCPNVDLCRACYTDLMADKSGLTGLVGEWKFCNPKKHEYLKGPVNGWKGVKDGVIRCEGKEIKFNVWLEGLKEMWKNLEL